jgi:Flp pilus assembly pilin Flp
VIKFAARFFADDEGQDLVEYALLTGFVAAAGLLVFQEMGDRMADGYQDWVTETNDIWEPCLPAPAPCP